MASPQQDYQLSSLPLFLSLSSKEIYLSCSCYFPLTLTLYVCITAALSDVCLCQEVGPSGDLCWLLASWWVFLGFFFFLTRASAKILSTNRVMVRDGHSPSRVSASFCERWRGFDTRAAASQGGSCLTRILINICSPSTHRSKEDACVDKLVLSHITVQPGALKDTK